MLIDHKYMCLVCMRACPTANRANKVMTKNHYKASVSFYYDLRLVIWFSL